MKPLLLTGGILSQVRTTSEPSWWAVKVTGLEGTGVGGSGADTMEGERNTRSPRDFSAAVGHVTQLSHFSSTLTQLLRVSLPALEQLRRLRRAAVQGKMVSHTWQEVGCNKGNHIRHKSVLGVVDGHKAEDLLYFSLSKPKPKNTECVWKHCRVQHFHDGISQT